ncbi:MAG: fibronectin type III domain-containing protein [Terriglobales bacterium]
MALLLAGCAQVGPVQAPSAGLLRPVQGFAARRAGEEIHLNWAPPTQTSDGAAYNAARYGALSYQVCVWPGVQIGAAPAMPPARLPGTGTPAPAQIPSRRAPLPGAGGRYPTPRGLLMPPCPHLLGLRGRTLALNRIASPDAAVATLALAVKNGAGNWAGWSNPVTVPLAPVTEAPRLRGVQLTLHGVRLRWTPPPPPSEAILVFRQNGTAPVHQIARLAGDRTSFLDTTAAWNQTYTYWLRSAVGHGLAMAESADSAHSQVFNADVFPPPQPTGLEAVRAPGSGGVDLSWNPVEAANFAGYNVYRRMLGASAWGKRNGVPLLTPVFHDALPAGVTGVAYAITSVDAAGKESQRSAYVVVR